MQHIDKEGLTYICWHCVNHPNYVRKCPFCGSFVVKDMDLWAECDQCGARGPKAKNGEDWKSLWNRRV